MGIERVCFAALVALAFAAAPARAESEGNGPAGNDGAFTGWVVPVGTGIVSATNTNADGYIPRPCFDETVAGTMSAGGMSGESGFNPWPALPLGGAGAGTTHARAPARGAPRG